MQAHSYGSDLIVLYNASQYVFCQFLGVIRTHLDINDCDPMSFNMIHG